MEMLQITPSLGGPKKNHKNTIKRPSVHKEEFHKQIEDYLLRRSLRRIKSKENEDRHGTQQHTEDAGPKTSHLNPIHPSAGPQLDVILRTPTGPPHRSPFPKPLDLSTRSRIANMPSPFIETLQDTQPFDEDTSRKLSTVKARHLDKNVGIEETKDTSGTRPRSGHISRARTPRGHAHRQGISETWTPTPVDTGSRSTPLGHGHLQKDT
jgi:hypothetical protein